MIETASRVALAAERELEALVAVSSPSGDVEGAEECAALAAAFLPTEAEVERVECSTPAHARDLVGRLEGSGERRVLLLGHLDTVVGHDSHRALERDGDRLTGSGTVDMKGGVALALALMRELTERTELFAEVAILLVNDEEWRTAPFAHAERFRHFDACLCFEGGERTADDGDEGVIVKRKAAATLRVDAYGRSSHSGSAPERGRSALLALTAAAQLVASHSDPSGPDHLTAVPTILRSGEAFNVVPASGELLCDLRADRLEAFDPVLAALPREHDEVRLEPDMVRAWPGMDSRAATSAVLEAASGRLGRAIVGCERGGASDASHVAAGGIELTIDGLGPLGGGAHTPEEWVSAGSLHARAEVALAVMAELLGAPKG